VTDVPFSHPSPDDATWTLVSRGSISSVETKGSSIIKADLSSSCLTYKTLKLLLHSKHTKDTLLCLLLGIAPLLPLHHQHPSPIGTHMASSSSFTASSGAHRTMLEREVTPLSEPSSSERIESLLGGEESSESIPSPSSNRPPRVLIHVFVPLAASRKRKSSNPKVTNPGVSGASKRFKRSQPTQSLILNIHGYPVKWRSMLLSSVLGKRLMLSSLSILSVMSLLSTMLWLGRANLTRECT